MRLRYYCHLGQVTGYGRAAADYLSALAAYTDIDLEVVPFELFRGDDRLEPSRYGALDRYVVAKGVGVPDLAVYHTVPRSLCALFEVWPEPPQVARVAVTTWETHPLPKAYARLGNYDAVIVPSWFCVLRMSPTLSAGVRTVVIPHCFDPAAWPVPGPTPHQSSDGPFRFYTLGAWSARKNLKGVLQAYLHAFTSDDNVALAIVSSNADLDDVRSLLARTGRPPEQLPQLHVPQDTLSDYEIVDLHVNGDCFVSATRSEGFGLPHFEAAICGRPLITPLWGGHNEFLGPCNTAVWAVDHMYTPCFGDEKRGEILQKDGGWHQSSTVAMPPGVDCRQYWAEPHLIDLSDAMRRVFRLRGKLNTDVAHSRKLLEASYGYKTIAEQLSGTFEDIIDEREVSTVTQTGSAG